MRYKLAKQVTRRLQCILHLLSLFILMFGVLPLLSLKVVIDAMSSLLMTIQLLHHSLRIHLSAIHFIRNNLDFGLTEPNRHHKIETIDVLDLVQVD